jgi:opacity protein-like surface antigen
MKFAFACCLFVCLAVSAAAQESPKSELFAGYSYLRTDEGEVDLLKLAGVVGTATRNGANLNGFNVEATYNLQRSFGIVVDFGGAFGTYTYTVNAEGLLSNQPVRTNLYTFLTGPQFYLRRDRYTLFGRGMIGVGKLKQSVFVVGQKFSTADTSFAAGFGGGMDWRLSDKLSARLFQADYILTRFEDFQAGDRVQGAIRVSTGLVVR